MKTCKFYIEELTLKNGTEFDWNDNPREYIEAGQFFKICIEKDPYRDLCLSIDEISFYSNLIVEEEKQ